MKTPTIKSLVTVLVLGGALTSTAQADSYSQGHRHARKTQGGRDIKAVRMVTRPVVETPKTSQAPNPGSDYHSVLTSGGIITY